MAPSRNSQRALLLSATLGLANAVYLPEATAAPAKVEVRAPVVTAAPIRFDERYSYVERRNILDDITSGVGGAIKSLESVIGTALPSFFTDGKPKTEQRASKACTDLSRHPWLVRGSPDW
jgi:hypothetical protein